MHEQSIAIGVIRGLREQGFVLVQQPTVYTRVETMTFCTAYGLEGLVDGRKVDAEMKVSKQYLAQSKIPVEDEVRRHLKIHYGKSLMEVLLP